jgi:hypothetical protein
MQGTLRWISPFLVLVLAGSVDAAEPKKTTTSKDPKKIVSSGWFEGKLTVLEGSTKNFTVQIEYLEQDPNKLAALQNYIAQAKLDIARTTNLNDRRNKSASYQVEIAKRTNDLNRKVTKDIKLEPTEDMKVRWHKPPVTYDENGKPKKKFTRKELLELKGPNKKLVGYMATADNLKVNQIVRVYLAKEKKKKSKDKEADLLEKRHKVVMVMIMEDPTAK